MQYQLIEKLKNSSYCAFTRAFMSMGIIVCLSSGCAVSANVKLDADGLEFGLGAGMASKEDPEALQRQINASFVKTYNDDKLTINICAKHTREEVADYETVMLEKKLGFSAVYDDNRFSEFALVAGVDYSKANLSDERDNWMRTKGNVSWRIGEAVDLSYEIAVSETEKRTDMTVTDSFSAINQLSFGDDVNVKTHVKHCRTTDNIAEKQLDEVAGELTIGYNSGFSADYAAQTAMTKSDESGKTLHFSARHAGAISGDGYTMDNSASTEYGGTQGKGSVTLAHNNKAGKNGELGLIAAINNDTGHGGSFAVYSSGRTTFSANEGANSSDTVPNTSTTVYDHYHKMPVK